MLAFKGAIFIPARTTGVTSAVVLPATEPDAAPIVLEPRATAVARPDEVMVATEGLEEFQFAELVISDMEPSVKVAVAVNCRVAPMVIPGEAGVTTMDAMTGAVTVSEVFWLTDPRRAEMEVVPAPELVARP